MYRLILLGDGCRFDAILQTLFHVSSAHFPCHSNPMLSSIKVRRLKIGFFFSFFLSTEIGSVSLLHVNPFSLCATWMLWFILKIFYFFFRIGKKKIFAQRSQIGVTAPCFIHASSSVSVFLLVWLLFSENTPMPISFPSSTICHRCDWRTVRWSSGSRGASAGLQACLGGSLTRQTPSSGHCLTHNTLGLIRHQAHSGRSLTTCRLTPVNVINSNFSETMEIQHSTFLFSVCKLTDLTL